MKQLNLLKTLFLLCALVVGSLNSWADNSYTLGWGNATGDAGTFKNFTATSGTVDDIVSFTTAKNNAGTAPAYNSNNKDLRLYYSSDGNGGSITLTPALGVTITSATITATSSYTPTVKYKVDGGEATNATLDNVTYTISSISATSSLIIQNANTTNTQLRIKTIQITYTVTGVPEHTATFSVNGVESSQDFKEGEDITFPTDPEIDGLEFMGWTTTPIVGTTDTEPAVLVKSATMSTADITYYAVFAKKTTVAGIQTYTLNYDTDVSSKTLGYGTSVDVTASDGSSWVVKAYKNNGMQINVGKDSSIKIPTCSGNIQSIVITCKQAKAVGLSASDYSGSGDITYLVSGTDALSQTLDLSGESVTAGYIVPKGGSTAITNIDVNFNGLVDIYSAYCTSVPTIAVSVTSVKYATFCDEIARDFSASGITVYAATATSTKVDFDEVTDGIVPANTGVVLYSATTKSDVAIPAAATASSYDFSSNEMIGINAKTSIAYAGEGSKKNYILANGTSGVGFYKAAVGGANLAAHKAYLSTTAAVTGRDFLGFEDETTGIEKVEAAQQTVGEYYNLAGQRVANPTKGLYIVNGKKVIK